MKKERCDGTLCEDVANICYAVDPEQVYVCTRKKGHKGSHIACSGMTHNMKSWPNLKKDKKVVDSCENI